MQSDKFVINAHGIQPEQKQNQLQVIVPNRIEKHLLMLSPYLPASKLPLILQRLATLGITVLDIQKLDYSQFQYLNGGIEDLKRESFITLRGRTFKSEVGYVLRLARENLRSHFLSQTKALERALDQLTEEHTIDQLMCLTSSRDEYKRVWFILRKGLLKTRYSDVSAQEDSKESEYYEKAEKDANYDSEDPDEYKDITLFNGANAKSSGARKTNVKPLKKLVDLA